MYIYILLTGICKLELLIALINRYRETTSHETTNKLYIYIFVCSLFVCLFMDGIQREAEAFSFLIYLSKTSRVSDKVHSVRTILARLNRNL